MLFPVNILHVLVARNRWLQFHMYWLIIWFSKHFGYGNKSAMGDCSFVCCVYWYVCLYLQVCYALRKKCNQFSVPHIHICYTAASVYFFPLYIYYTWIHISALHKWSYSVIAVRKGSIVDICLQRYLSPDLSCSMCLHAHISVFVGIFGCLLYLSHDS